MCSVTCERLFYDSTWPSLDTTTRDYDKKLCGNNLGMIYDSSKDKFDDK